MFVFRFGQKVNKLYKGPPIDASCKVWFHLAKWFQRRRFLKTQQLRIKNCPWRPCFLSDPDEMNKLYKGPPIEASCKVLFHLAERFQRRRFLKTPPIRIKNCPWRPCFLSYPDEMNILYKRPPIDASCKVWFNLVQQFWEEKIKIWKVNGRTTDNDGRFMMAKAHMTLWVRWAKKSRLPEIWNRIEFMLIKRVNLKKQGDILESQNWSQSLNPPLPHPTPPPQPPVISLRACLILEKTTTDKGLYF